MLLKNPARWQRVIGLTGGIATGKSTVAEHLASLDVPILDADIYARQAVQPGALAFKKIAQRYGSSVVSVTGQLNRQALAEIIFSDRDERLWLEAQIHPYVRDRLQAEQRALADAPVIVMVVPLLFEAQMTDLVTEIWVVACPTDLQLQRLVRRDALTLEQAKARIESQFPLAVKTAQANLVLNNSSTPAALCQQIEQALSKT